MKEEIHTRRFTLPLDIGACRYRSYTDESGTYYCMFKEYSVDYRECRGCILGVGE